MSGFTPAVVAIGGGRVGFCDLGDCGGGDPDVVGGARVYHRGGGESGCGEEEEGGGAHGWI